MQRCGMNSDPVCGNSKRLAGKRSVFIDTKTKNYVFNSVPKLLVLHKLTFFFLSVPTKPKIK